MTTPIPEERSDDRRDENKAVVRRIYEDCLSAGKLELLDELVAAEFTGPDGSTGPESFKRVARGLRGGFPDLHYQVEDLLADGDRVAIRWTLTGTHRGAFRGFEPTHQRISSVGFAVFVLRDGKVVRSWMETDRLGFLDQIGALPPELAARLRPPAQ